MSAQDEGCRVLLVGENNPYGANPEFALYCYPPGCSGWRLRRILGLPEEQYLDLHRTNLCTGDWSNEQAKARGLELLVPDSLWNVAYVKDVVERETEPYTKIALFVRSMLEGLLGPRIHGLPTSGSARSHVTRVDLGLDRPSFVGVCTCGWMSTLYYWSNLTTGVSEELARSKAEEQCDVHVLAVEWCALASISNTEPSRRS